jgi:hypothetical protein
LQKISKIRTILYFLLNSKKDRIYTIGLRDSNFLGGRIVRIDIGIDPDFTVVIVVKKNHGLVINGQNFEALHNCFCSNQCTFKDFHGLIE